MSNTWARTPLVWILKGPKAGDYAQLRALATTIGWPFLVKQLVFRQFELLVHARPRPTLVALDRAASDPLEPPWPDVVLTAGRRNELVARHVRAASGGQTRLVHVGRPWSHPDHFDLVISNRQYMLESSDRVLVNDLPLHDIDALSLAAERTRWELRFAHVPRSWTVLLTGGDSGPLVLTAARARELGRQVNALLSRVGGSLLVTTSARTPRRSADALLQTLVRPAFVFRFPSAAENPYRGLLACGDRFVVTGDSMSMLAEACGTGKPVYVYDFANPGPWWRDASAYQWKPFVHRLAMTVGPRRMRRDVHRIHRALLDTGRIRLLDDGRAPEPHRSESPGDGELVRTALRVRALLAQR
jgi:mitochondrial fission protein ELM1